MQPMTDNFRNDVLEKRPYIRLEWCKAALQDPLQREVQPEDGRIRHWEWVDEIRRYLRVVTLSDGVTLHKYLPRQEIHAMRLNYDAATDSLYIHLNERPSVNSDEVVDGVVLDYDASGALVGIDVQHASKKADIHRLALNHLPLTRLEAA